MFELLDVFFWRNNFSIRGLITVNGHVYLYTCVSAVTKDLRCTYIRGLTKHTCATRMTVEKTMNEYVFFNQNKYIYII